MVGIIQQQRPRRYMTINLSGKNLINRINKLSLEFKINRITNLPSKAQLVIA